MTTLTLPATRLPDRRTLTGAGAMLTTTALWGLVFLGPELAPGLPAPLLAGLRYLAHGLASLAVLRRVAQRGATPDWWRAARHGLAGFVGYYLLVTIAVRTGGASLVVVLMSTSPVVLTLASRPGVPLRRLAGPFATILAGGVLATVGDGIDAAGLRTLLLTAVLVAGGMAIWTWYALDNEKVVARDDLDLTRWTATTGVATGLVSLPLVAYGLAVAPTARVVLDPTAIAVLLVLGLGSTTLANRAFNTATRNLGSARTGAMLVFEPVFGLTWAHLWIGSMPSGRVLLGEALLVIGAMAALVVLQNARRRAARPTVSRGAAHPAVPRQR